MPKPTASGLHVLVKWITQENCWDHYSVRQLKDVDVATRIAVATVYTEFIDMEVDVYWEEGKESSPGKIVSIGTSDEMEKRLKREVNKIAKKRTDRSEATIQQNQSILSNVDEGKNNREEVLIAKNEKLKEKMKRLSEENDNLRKLAEVDQWIKRLKKSHKKLEKVINDNGFASSAQPEMDMVDLGNEVQIKRCLLINAEHAAGGSPCQFARSLFLGLFSANDLAECSISGKQSNAFKHIPARKQLDPAKINSIITFTCEKYNCARNLIKRSLQDKIKEVRNKKEKNTSQIVPTGDLNVTNSENNGI